MFNLATRENQAKFLVSLLLVKLHLLIRLIKLAGLLLRFQLADDLLEHLHRFETALALETLDVQFHAAVLADGDVKFALRHKTSVQALLSSFAFG